MESVTIPDLSLNSTLLTHVVYETLLSKIVKEINTIPNIPSFRLSSAITKTVCIIVEEAVASHKKKVKVDKKKLVIAILTSVFSLTPAEQNTVGLDIELLLEDKLIPKVVKAVSTKVYHKLLKHTIGKK